MIEIVEIVQKLTHKISLIIYLEYFRGKYTYNCCVWVQSVYLPVDHMWRL